MASEASRAAASETTSATTPEFEPKIVAFVCNWCTYTGADLAGTSRLQMAPNVRVVRLPCTGRIDPLFITKAFEGGADGVIVSGCHPADCHYTAGRCNIGPVYVCKDGPVFTAAQLKELPPEF
jgi:hypothetical protein